MSHSLHPTSASSNRLPADGDDYASIDRLLEAVHRGTVDTFINDEAHRAGVPIAIGTLVMSDEQPRWATAATTFVKLARHAESRPALNAYARPLRDAARACTGFAALSGSGADAIQLSTIIADDPAEGAFLVSQILQLSLMSTDGRKDVFSRCEASTEERPSGLTFEDALNKARAIREMVLRGDEAEARREALTLGRDVIAYMLLTASRDEGMLPRSRLAAVMRALSSCGVLDGSNIIAMVDAALKADVDTIRANNQPPIRPVR